MDPNEEIAQLRRQLDQALKDAVAREAELQRYHQQLEAANAKLQELATTDPLTGVANRRVFDSRLAVDWRDHITNHRLINLVFSVCHVLVAWSGFPRTARKKNHCGGHRERHSTNVSVTPDFHSDSGFTKRFLLGTIGSRHCSSPRILRKGKKDA